MPESVGRKRQHIVFLPFSAGQLATQMQKEQERREGGEEEGRAETEN